ncbi:unnamed protein product, partial [Prorocentrum cordatum]
DLTTVVARAFGIYSGRAGVAVDGSHDSALSPAIFSLDGSQFFSNYRRGCRRAGMGIRIAMLMELLLHASSRTDGIVMHFVVLDVEPGITTYQGEKLMALAESSGVELATPRNPMYVGHARPVAILSSEVDCPIE